jgi:hypothetical protein
MPDEPIPDADEADAQEQTEEVAPAGPPTTLAAAGHLELPVDASEADALEQLMEVPVDDDER